MKKQPKQKCAMTYTHAPTHRKQNWYDNRKNFWNGEMFVAPENNHNFRNLTGETKDDIVL